MSLSQASSFTPGNSFLILQLQPQRGTFVVSLLLHYLILGYAVANYRVYMEKSNIIIQCHLEKNYNSC